MLPPLNLFLVTVGGYRLCKTIIDEREREKEKEKEEQELGGTLPRSFISIEQERDFSPSGASETSN